ncbi:hypothetical protein D9M72_408430 [compost metagenome]
MHIVDERFDSFFLHHQLGKIAVAVFLEFSRHSIERLGKVAELIVCFKIHALGIVFCSDLSDAFRQVFYGICYVARQVDEQSKSNHKAGEACDGNPKDSTVGSFFRHDAFSLYGIHVDLHDVVEVFTDLTGKGFIFRL